MSIREFITSYVCLSVYIYKYMHMRGFLLDNAEFFRYPVCSFNLCGWYLHSAEVLNLFIQYGE